jgi:hypothetical protein
MALVAKSNTSGIPEIKQKTTAFAFLSASEHMQGVDD